MRFLFFCRRRGDPSLSPSAEEGKRTAAGAAILWREWRAYQYAKAHKDDPDTWTLDDDPAPEAGTAEPEEPEEPKDREKGREEP